jgi:hypothetical protein
MKKIQVSTVKQTADVEVIYVNSNLISKAIKSLVALEQLDSTIERDSMRIDTIPEVDAEGKPVVDGLTGEVKTKEIEFYDSLRIDGQTSSSIHKIVVPFLKELTNAFEEE